MPQETQTNVCEVFCRNTGTKSEMQQYKQLNKNAIRNIAGTPGTRLENVLAIFAGTSGTKSEV